MTTLKSKLLVLTLLLIGVVTMSFTFLKNEKVEVESEVKVTTTWRYIGTSTGEGEFAKIENWEEGTGTSCIPQGSLPCQLTANVADEDELEELLFNQSNSAVLDMADSHKN